VADEPICVPARFRNETPGKPLVVHGVEDVFFKVN